MQKNESGRGEKRRRSGPPAPFALYFGGSLDRCRHAPVPLFFGRGGGVVENSLQGLAGQFSSLVQGDDFGLGEDMARGCVLAGSAELADEGQGLLDDQGFDGISQTEGAGLHERLPTGKIKTAAQQLLNLSPAAAKPQKELPHPDRCGGPAA
jgi:hypothetical protein